MDPGFLCARQKLRVSTRKWILSGQNGPVTLAFRSVPCPRSWRDAGWFGYQSCPSSRNTQLGRTPWKQSSIWLILISSWWHSCHSWHVIGEQQPGLYPHPRDGTPGKIRGQASKCYTVCPDPTTGKEYSPTATNPFNWLNQNMWAIARKSAKERSTGSAHIQAYCFQGGQGKGRNLVKNKAAASQFH